MTGEDKRVIKNEGVTVGGIGFGPMQVDWETRIDYPKMRRERLQRARDAMAEFGLDYLILLRQENGRYVTSAKRLYWPTIMLGGGPLVVLPREGLPGLWIVDIDLQAKALSWLPKDRIRNQFRMDAEHEVEAFIKEALEMFGPDIEQRTIGVDIWSPAMYKVLPQKLPKAKFVNGQEVMLHARMIKTPDEINCMKMAYAISEAGMQAAVDVLKPGIRECELVGACFNKFWNLGSETSQCSQAVNSGPATMPYRRFHTDRIVLAGDMVNMDFGACFSGYFGDFCRAFVCGKKPSKDQLSFLRQAYDVQMENLNAIRPGITPAELCEKLGRKQIGHSIGISALEPPILFWTHKDIIQPGMTFSVLTPIIGNPTAGGVHLEDEVVVTEKGCEVYSTFPYTGIDD